MSGDGIVQIEQGDPRYCPLTVEHEPHRFTYAFGERGNEVTGWYDCDGIPLFPTTPDSEPVGVPEGTTT